MKHALSYLGALASLGFLAASAVINYTFGFRLGRTLIEQHTLAIVAILAVAMNGLAPFYIQWAKNRPARAAAGLIWLLCILYTIASAIGFAAENRAATTGTREAQHLNLQTVEEQLDDELAAKKKNPRKIAELRQKIIEYRDKGASIEPDSQSKLIAKLVYISPSNVNLFLVVLFAVLIEIGAALGLYASLAHLAPTPPPRPDVHVMPAVPWTPKKKK